MAPENISRALDALQGHFELKKLELRASDLRLDDWGQIVAVQVLSGVVIHMSLLTGLSLPENLVSEFLLLHISLLPRLETLTVSPASVTSNLFGEESHGFVSLRSLNVPNENLFCRFLLYTLRDLEVLKVGKLGRNSLQRLSRNLTSLKKIYIEDPGFSLQEISVLGACFRLEEIKIVSPSPLKIDGLHLHRFRDRFRNLRSFSIVAGRDC